MAINLDEFDNQAGKNNTGSVKSYLNALAQSGQLGVMEGLGTAIQKGGSKFTQGIGNFLSPIVNQGLSAVNAPFRVETRTPQNSQQEFEQNLVDTKNNPDVQAHPIVSAVGRLGGNMAIQYPIMKALGLNGPSPSSLFSEAGANAVAKSMAGNALMGAGFSQDGKQSVFNPEGALVAGLASGPLMAGQMAIGNYLTKIGQKSGEAIIGYLSKDAPKSLNLTQNMIQGAVEPYTGMVDVQKLTSSIPDHPAMKLLQEISPLIGSLVKQGGVVGTGAAIGAGVGMYQGGPENAVKGALAGAGAGLGVKGIMASPAAIGKLLSYSPIKSLLTQMNSLGAQVSKNPEIATYMANKFNNYLTNAGIDLMLQNGNVANLITKPTKAQSSVNLDDFDNKSTNQ